MNIATNPEWSSHQPLIQAVMEFYKPKFVLELGMGEFSTPYLMSNFRNPDIEYLGIENDKEWIEHLKTKLGDFKTLFHDLGSDIKLGTHLPEISEEKKNEIINYYKSLEIPNIHPSVLFVDQFTCARTLSINTLGNKFDIIMYHDCQPEGIAWYNYDLINLPEYKSYYLKSDVAWTGLLIKNIDENFASVVNKYSEEYLKNNPSMKTMKFIL
jgi:hypothetical protein